jgi:hypothetical protein
MNEKLLRLQALSHKNNDKWSFEWLAVFRGKNIVYTFTVTEDADGHIILSGTGQTPENALDEALATLPSLADFGYTLL